MPLESSPLGATASRLLDDEWPPAAGLAAYAAGRHDEAQRLIERARAALAEHPESLTGLRLELARAAVEQAAGDLPRAAALLEPLLRAARERGLWSLALDAERQLRALTPASGGSL